MLDEVLIYGKGISGRGAELALKRRGALCVVCDDSDFDRVKDGQYSLAVISPGIDFNHSVYRWAKERNIKAISELELGYTLCDKPVIAVTGTNGKTTTTELIGRMFKNRKACVTGNIGRAFSLSVTEENAEAYIVECSSFQLEKIDAFRPRIAVITNISPDHIDRHGSMEGYANAKLKILQNQQKEDYAVISYDDIEVGYLKGICPRSTVIYTSLRQKVNGAYIKDGKVWFYDEEICKVNRIRANGVHNLANALCAVAVSKLYGISNAEIVNALCEYSPSKHRLSFVCSIRGVAFYNDSKGTNVDATVKAMQSMPSGFCIIVGGKDKGYEFDELIENAPKTLEKMCIIGECSKKIKDACDRHGFKNYMLAESFDKAIIEAYHSKCDCVLLSPATSSFDMFSNYEERGERFEETVRGLKRIEERR